MTHKFLSYDQFRTGLTFRDVYIILDRERKALRQRGAYMFITRHTVLGRWREIKLRMYKEYEQYAKIYDDDYQPEFLHKTY